MPSSPSGQHGQEKKRLSLRCWLVERYKRREGEKAENMIERKERDSKSKGRVAGIEIIINYICSCNEKL